MLRRITSGRFVGARRELLCFVGARGRSERGIGGQSRSRPAGGKTSLAKDKKRTGALLTRGERVGAGDGEHRAVRLQGDVDASGSGFRRFFFVFVFFLRFRVLFSFFFFSVFYFSVCAFSFFVFVFFLFCLFVSLSTRLLRQRH